MEIKVEIDSAVATVTLNDPDRRNALTAKDAGRLSESIEAAAGPEVRCIILTGAGKAFCAGGNFEDLKRLSRASEADATKGLYEGFQAMIRTVRSVRVPVIAAVNGPAMGAGLDLALACDIRVASEQARFGMVFVKVGIVPGTGGAFWVSLLAGPGRAAQMIYTGEVADARKALEWGLVNEVVKADQLIPRATELALAISQEMPGAVAANKRALDEVLKPHYEAALQYAAGVQSERFASEEFREALERLTKKA